LDLGSASHGRTVRSVVNRTEDPNGCFVETVIAAAIDRVEYYQRGKFACANNEMVLMRLNDALALLDACGRPIAKLAASKARIRNR
jgi:hypothetical protein